MEELVDLVEGSVERFNIKGTYVAKVVRCYDGDTLFCIMRVHDKLQEVRIRMLGYNSCEMKPKKNVVDRENVIKKAMESKQKLEELCLGKIVKVEADVFDDFGRVLAKVYVDNVCVNDVMLDGGYGVPFVR